MDLWQCFECISHTLGWKITWRKLRKFGSCDWRAKSVRCWKFSKENRNVYRQREFSWQNFHISVYNRSSSDKSFRYFSFSRERKNKNSRIYDEILVASNFESRRAFNRRFFFRNSPPILNRESADFAQSQFAAVTSQPAQYWTRVIRTYPIVCVS